MEGASTRPRNADRTQAGRIPPQVVEQARKLWDEKFKDRVYLLNGVEQNRAAVDAEFNLAVQALMNAAATQPSAADSDAIRRAVDDNTRVWTLREQISSLQAKVDEMYQKGLVDSHQEMIRAKAKLADAQRELDEVKRQIGQKAAAVLQQNWAQEKP